MTFGKGKTYADTKRKQGERNANKQTDSRSPQERAGKRKAEICVPAAASWDTAYMEDSYYGNQRRWSVD